MYSLVSKCDLRGLELLFVRFSISGLGLQAGCRAGCFQDVEGQYGAGLRASELRVCGVLAF